ncbi:MAG: endo-1,4-beta-xylanase [Cyclobacteriaceae bacterium]|nr:endo-1,4-beta-xylanase [Cyclobacteriaceae bacterium]
MKYLIIIVLQFTMFCACSNNDPEPTVETPTVQSLKHYIEQVRPDFKIGVFFNDHPGNKEPHLDFIKSNFNAVTLGVYMKGNQPAEGTYDFSSTTPRLNFALDNQMWIKLHPVFGHNTYNPEWLVNGNYTGQQLSDIMEGRIDTLLSLYGNDVDALDVVNEAVPWDSKGTIWDEETAKNKWLELGFKEQGGKKWPVFIDHAFRTAKEHKDQGVQFILNENNNSQSNSLRANNFFEAVKILLDNGVPLDGVGMQMHWSVKNGVVKQSHSGVGAVLDLESIRNTIKMYGDMGLDVHISEFDVHLPENPTTADYDLQAKTYRDILKIALESPACKSFITWGTADKKGWAPTGYNPHALWLDDDFKPKKNFHETLQMVKALQENDL